MKRFITMLVMTIACICLLSTHQRVYANDTELVDLTSGGEVSVPVSFTENDKLSTSENWVGCVIPVKVEQAGFISILFSDNDAKAQNLISHRMYSDKELTREVVNVNSSSALDAGAFYVQEKGVYYVLAYVPAFAGSKLIANETWKIKFFADDIINVDVGKYDYAYSSVVNNIIYLKYKAPKDGVYTIKSSHSLGTVSVLDSGNRVIAPETFMQDAVKIGVKKGKTYLIKIDYKFGALNGYHEMSVRTQLKAKVVTRGKTKKKALTLQKNKKKQGVIAAGNQNVVWYKFKLKKSQKCKITISGDVFGGVTVALYKDKQRLIKTKHYSGEYVFTSREKIDKSGNLSVRKKMKLKSGTYYIKVKRRKSNSGGVFAVKLEY